MLPHRQPHPVQDSVRLTANRLLFCDTRGFCGPFINADYYDAWPEPHWRGLAECVHCGGTVRVAAHEEARRQRLAGVRRRRRSIRRRTAPPIAQQLALF